MPEIPDNILHEASALVWVARALGESLVDDLGSLEQFLGTLDGLAQRAKERIDEKVDILKAYGARKEGT